MSANENTGKIAFYTPEGRIGAVYVTQINADLIARLGGFDKARNMVTKALMPRHAKLDDLPIMQATKKRISQLMCRPEEWIKQQPITMIVADCEALRWSIFAPLWLSWAMQQADIDVRDCSGAVIAAA